jgi:lipopolysaccharide exporter
MLKGNALIVVIAAIAQNLLRLISTITLSRLLSPDAFGVAGLVATIQFTIVMLTDVGLQPYLVRHPRDDPEFLDEVWSIRAARSLLLGVLSAAAAFPLSIVLGKPEMAVPLSMVGVLFALDTCTSLAYMTAVRAEKILRVSVIDVAVTALTLIVSLGLALVWKTYWALLVGSSVAVAARCVLSYVAFPDSGRRLRFSRERISELLTFARFIMGSSLVALLLAQADKFVLGRVLPLNDLGFYFIASSIAAGPVFVAINIGQRVFYPAFARVVRDGGDFRNVFYATRWKVTAVFMFATGVLVGAAPLVVRVLYAPRYSGVGIYLALLAVAPLLVLCTVANNEALVARGQQWITLQLNIIRVAWLLIAGTVGMVTFGGVGFVAAVGLMEIPALMYGWLILRRDGLLDLHREALLLLTGLAGVLAGYGAWRLGSAWLAA